MKDGNTFATIGILPIRENLNALHSRNKGRLQMLIISQKHFFLPIKCCKS
jgi:hypothetical protein